VQQEKDQRKHRAERDETPAIGVDRGKDGFPHEAGSF
jgi:hypothetical protein